MTRATRRWMARAALLTAMLSACAGQGTSAEPVITRDVSYRPGLSLDVIAPRGRNMPVSLVLHGAGLERSAYEPFALRLAERNVVVFNIDWTVLPPSEGLQDVGCALRFAAQTARERGGAPDRITLVAHSTAFAVAGAVAMTGSRDIADCAHEPGPAPVGLVGISPFQVVGGEVWPRSLLGENGGLRIRLIEGDDDPLVRPGSSDHTVRLLREAGYDTDLVLVAGGHHNIVMVAIGDPADEGAEATLDAVNEIVQMRR